MPARSRLSAPDAWSRLWPSPVGVALVLGLAGICLTGCRPPEPEGTAGPSATFSRPVATLGPDDAVSNTAATVVTSAAAPGWSGLSSADRLGRAIALAGRVSLPIDFDTDSASLRNDAGPVIDEVATLLRNDPALRLSIDVHADASGDAGHDHDLSQRRADAVRAVLVSQGIEGGRLQARGHGSDRPAPDPRSAGHRAARHRVELARLD